MTNHMYYTWFHYPNKPGSVYLFTSIKEAYNFINKKCVYDNLEWKLSLQDIYNDTSDAKIWDICRGTNVQVAVGCGSDLSESDVDNFCPYGYQIQTM